jgi:hypothetical protein
LLSFGRSYASIFWCEYIGVVPNYITKSQASQNGIIGITLVSHWFEPASKEKADVDAAKRGLDFMLGW